MRTYCPYCGNTSGKEDERGMCISCGGHLERNNSPYSGMYNGASGTVYGNNYSGISGSHGFILGEYGKEIYVTQDVFKCLK